MTTLLIKGGRVIDPANGVDEIADIYIEDGRIAAAGGKAKTEIDASGLIVCPGLIDMHVHLREPGQEWKEDIESGSRAAVAGGVTSMCCMPNTKPRLDHAGVVRQVIERARQVGLCDVYPIGAVSRDLEGKELTEMRELMRAGAVAFSDDGNPIWHSGVMRKALEYASTFDFLIIQHAEDLQLTKGGCMNEGRISTQLGVSGMPAVGEDDMVSRDIMLAKLADARYHVAHISTRGAVELVRRAQAEGLKVTTEAAPHHFALTEEELLGFNADAKMSPPLRTEEDRQAVIEGLRDGTISVIATDHAPHHEDDKHCGLSCAAFGIVGLESMLPVSLGLEREGVLPMSDLIATMTSNPAKLLHLDAGTLSEGAAADICIFNPDEKWTLDRNKLFSKSRNTPWHGREMTGKVVHTIKNGRVVFQKGDVIG
ncbi:MAG: dihydroorotase [Zetaproteobacteria bacterium CG12_big_fil_rev_8_21_14_0_65_55_1124]|nr:MAG: dihydroorotase [Zetaproteobacteria bacterium CG1_02_55_237]PIS18524.1 MAG: dihydroorotase [Zetaproteobacteria bacterium CG08_land_8_20_14_0_20_55_17]PIW42002.1 MAG: dihydroorotase [Zetaproteobacteria bacterium CG12_big_fil_rev_8_21_14_0_65_55_1124]PIY53906.1 MAG: dihydroorotase [Zetaproteobacteria bacterium CG_4_10_14_0_8_um_filter_55_43]PIZ39351.1 MAG: dihydroorotase [Zetaproteobacteria bacterium CG_4_10_14_0_2_um_filter_55_20]PJB80706.1 MAG: dihydroorotase [Zetaproteobacteria bacteri